MWHYGMTVDHFNDLAGPGYHVPRYLFLIVVPADRAIYAEADVDMLRLRHSGYWVSLADRALIDPAAQGSVTVHVHKRNLLTVAAMRALMSPIPVHRVVP
jgi:hypothetical protein